MVQKTSSLRMTKFETVKGVKSLSFNCDTLKIKITSENDIILAEMCLTKKKIHKTR